MMKLRKATFDDWELLLNWRNDDNTRKNFHNTLEVDENIHKNWLRSVLLNTERPLFIVIENDCPVGMVRADFDRSSLVYELSWTVAPYARGRGIGCKMVMLLMNKLTGCKRAEIKKDNLSSIKIAEFVGMKLLKEDKNILYYSTCP